MITGRDILYISSIEWDFLWQAHQEIARRLAAAGNRVLYRDGLPVALLAGGEVQFLETLEPATEWQARIALLRSAMPTELAHQVAYLPDEDLNTPAVKPQ